MDAAPVVAPRRRHVHGRVFSKRCDLSPSGRHLVYFAAKHENPAAAEARHEAGYSSTWTAVSRPPYFTAVALWQNGGSSYHGGGLFARDDVLELNQLARRAEAHRQHRPPRTLRVRDLVVPFGDAIAVLRAQRDGFTLREARLDAYDFPEQGVLVRRNAAHALTIEHHFGANTPDYRLLGDDGGAAGIVFDGVTWADFDRRNRLVFAREGCLFALDPGATAARLLLDLRGQQPDPQPSASWASNW